MYTTASPILGVGKSTAAQIDRFFEARGRSYAGNDYEPAPVGIGQMIRDAARRWVLSVNHDLLAAQIVHEAAAWQSEYARERNNPSGLGAVNHDPDQAIRFQTPQDGIRATVAHLLTYVSGPGPWTEYDPRAEATPAGWQGSVKLLRELEQKWAFTPWEKYRATPEDQRYGAKIATIANQLLAIEVDDVPTPTNLIPTEADIGYPVEVIWAADKGPARAISSVKWFVVHKTEGFRAGDIPTLTKPTSPVASAHCWIGKDGTLVFMVYLDITAWTSGNEAVDIQAINMELEGFVKEETTEAQYRSAAAFFRWCESQGMDVPREFVAYDERPGIIGHMHVADPKDDGTWGGHSGHTDPGDLFDWDRFIAAINEDAYVPPAARDELTFEGVPYKIVLGFKQLFLEQGAAKFEDDPIAGGLSLFGYPLGDEEETDYGSRQKFERCVMRWERDTGRPFDLVLQLRSDDAT